MAEEKETKMEVTPITEGKLVEKTKFQKALGIFLEEDEELIKQSIFEDFVKPRSKSFAVDLGRKIREFIADSINDAVRAFLFPSKKRGYKSEYNSVDRNGSRTKYVEYYNGTADSYDRSGSTYTFTKTKEPEEYHDPRVIKKIIIPSYGKAKEVIDDLSEEIRKHNKVSVSYYYQLVDVKVKTTKEDNAFGWTSLEGVDAHYDQKLGGYIIDFSRPVALNK